MRLEVGEDLILEEHWESKSVSRILNSLTEMPIGKDSKQALLQIHLRCD
ncbi:hypothetical protein LINPERHAP1_LOCUS39690, partial [Linum perenne]